MKIIKWLDKNLEVALMIISLLVIVLLWGLKSLPGNASVCQLNGRRSWDGIYLFGWAF